MTTQLYIQGVLVDLEEQKFKYVLQVNDFFDLKTRQSSFSQNIKLFKTAINLNLFELAGTYPNQSNKPYQRLSTDYLVDGVPVVLDAFGVLKNTDDAYNFHFYDGNIDLYKAIEKLKITDLPFDDFTHTKNVNGVIETWQNDYNYVYAVADYGGIPEYNNAINIDFLVPSISVEWVFDKIFEITGFRHEINPNVLTEKYFTISDAYKDVSDPDNFDPIVDVSKTLEFGSNTINRNVNKYVANVIFAEPSEQTEHVTDAFIFTAPQTGHYDIVHDITKTFPRYRGALLRFDQMPQIGLTKTPNANASEIESIFGLQNVPRNPSQPNVDYEGWGARLAWRNIQLQAGEQISIVAVGDSGFAVGYQGTDYGQQNFIHEPTNTQIIYKPEDQVSLPEYLSDLQIKDLFSEILIQNALTPILNKDGVYRFYTLDERLNAPIIDWSDKFVRVTNEDYVIGEYGQKNTFTYKYNDDGENHNDGTFLIDNAQLKDEDFIKSKFYGAEREKTYFETLSMFLPEFLLWKEDIKETDDGTEIKYKELKNHYHFLKVEDLNGSFDITSKGYATPNTPTNKIKVADFEPFKWENIINESYSHLGDILNRMSLYEVEVLLNPLDIQSFDFFCRIYIKELGAVFLPNKIIYEPNEVAKVQLIKITGHE